jgi:serine/threonine protein kinase
MAYCCIGRHTNEPGALWCRACGSLVAGAMIGDYRLLSYVGKGSTAEVYLAEQPALMKRKVIIKILPQALSGLRAETFQREASALASLSHPYILPIFSYGLLDQSPCQDAMHRVEPEHDDQHEQAEEPARRLPYLVLSYAGGGSLADIFVREGRRPWSLIRVVTMAREIADALDYAHGQGLLHRDVKPANILYMGSHALLSDFSVATLIDADVSHLNAPWAGSPAYMAPEVWQLSPGRYSDQYALAVTCFYLLSGELPLHRREGPQSRSWAHLHCFVPPRSIREPRPELPIAVDLVLQRALAKNPHDRYATVTAFAADLLAAAQDITQDLVALIDTREIGSNPHADAGTHGPQAHVGTHSPQAHVGTHSPQTHMDTHSPQTHMDTHSPQTHMDAHGPQTHMDAHGPQTHMDAHDPQAHMDAHGPQTPVGADLSRPSPIYRPPAALPARPSGQDILPPAFVIQSPDTAPVDPARAPQMPRKKPAPLHDVGTGSLVPSGEPGEHDRWALYAMLLNLVICLTLAGESWWQGGRLAAAATFLLAVWPALVIGPLLARLFRRTSFTSLSWGFFWGTFFGLTDGLLSTLVCLAWVLLAELASSFRCPPWCNSGDGLTLLTREFTGIAPLAILPVVIGLWAAVIGGALIGVSHVRYKD